MDSSREDVALERSVALLLHQSLQRISAQSAPNAGHSRTEVYWLERGVGLYHEDAGNRLRAQPAGRPVRRWGLQPAHGMHGDADPPQERRPALAVQVRPPLAYVWPVSTYSVRSGSPALD
jgi:hypothetical protein